MDIKQQAALLRRGTVGVTPENGLEEKLAKSARTGKPLKIKLGLDPTAPDIHLGFAIPLRKLRQFQDLGHEVIIIIGDYTALIGDPSGRSATRPQLSGEEIQENARTYVDQLARILDRDRTTVRFNSEWLGKLSFAEVIQLASKITLAQVMERDDFSKRWAQGHPISLHELLYPLAQAYDSVAIEADVEMGGKDQTFNILTGRDLQRALGREPQAALFMPLLVGLDGVQKMSKSLGNYVGITEPPDTMFGKLMSISDEMMQTYFELCTNDVEKAGVERLIKHAKKSTPLEFHPRARWYTKACRKLANWEIRCPNLKDVKRLLAHEIVEIYHGTDKADAADAEFDRVHARHELPEEIPAIALPGDAIRKGTVWACRLLVSVGLAKGTSEARRLIEQGGVKINGEKVSEATAEFTPAALDGAVIQVGSRHFVRVRG